MKKTKSFGSTLASQFALTLLQGLISNLQLIGGKRTNDIDVIIIYWIVALVHQSVDKFVSSD